MKEIINSETASLILLTYKKINTIKRLLNDEPYSKIKEFIESGTTLSEMMNNAIGETTTNGLKSKLILLSTHLKNRPSLSSSFQNIQQKQEITALFEELKADISLLQSKINAQP